MAFWRATDVDLPQNSAIVTVNTGDDVDSITSGYIIQINAGQFLEVKTVNTGTSPQTIELYQIYTGTAITGGTAIAAPTQGAIKEATEELRNLRTTYETLADSVSSTATANSVVKRNGSAQVLVADATASNHAVAFGQLGSAATKDVTISRTDTDDTRLLRVSDFGLGEISFTEYPLADLDDTSVPCGFYRLINNNPSAGTRPEGFSVFGFILVQSYDPNTKLQVYTDVNGKRAFRVIATGNIRPWQELYHSGNSVNPLDYGIGTASGKAWPNGYDISDITGVETGIYKIYVPSPTTALGYPEGYSSASNFTIYYNVEAEGIRAAILLIDVKTGQMYTRGYNNGWLGWRTYYNSGNSVNPLDYGIGGISIPMPDNDFTKVADKTAHYWSDSASLNGPPVAGAYQVFVMSRSVAPATSTLQFGSVLCLNRDNGRAYYATVNAGIWTWRTLFTDATANFNEFGGGNNGDVIATGLASSENLVRFYFPLSSKSDPTSMSVTGTFKIKINGNIILTTSADVLDLKLKAYGTKKLAVVEYETSGLTRGQFAELIITDFTSKIIFNF